MIDKIAAVIDALDRRNTAGLDMAITVAGHVNTAARGHVFQSIGIHHRDRLTPRQTATLIVTGQLPIGTAYSPTPTPEGTRT